MANKPLRLILDFLAYSGNQTNDPQDAQKIKSSVEEDNVNEIYRYQAAIADGAADQAINLPDADTDYLIIHSDQEISFKLNGSSDIIEVKNVYPGIKNPVFFMRGSISSLSISNASGNIANVDIVAINI